jgi:hypothetical protein
VGVLNGGQPYSRHDDLLGKVHAHSHSKNCQLYR